MKRFILSDLLIKASLLCLSVMLIASGSLMAQNLDTRTDRGYGTLQAHLLKRITRRLDSVYVYIKVVQAARPPGSPQAALGDAEFSFSIDEIGLGANATIDTTPNIASHIVRRGAWDGANNPDYLPMTITRGLGGKYIIVRVRKRPTLANPSSASLLAGNIVLDETDPSFDSDPLSVVVFGFKVINCQGKIALNWKRRNLVSNISTSQVIGYINPFKSDERFGGLDYRQSDNLPFLLRKPLAKPLANRNNLPQNVLISWNRPKKSSIYSAPTAYSVVIMDGRTKAVRRVVQLDAGTLEYRYYTVPNDSVCARVFAKSIYCQGDSVGSDTICGRAQSCAILKLRSVVIKPTADTSICPLSAYTITVDTAALRSRGLNTVKLDNPTFIFDGVGQSSPSYTFSAPIVDRVVTVTYRDINNCFADSTIRIRVKALRFIDPRTTVQIDGDTVICNRNRDSLRLIKTGDNLNYSWRIVKGNGRFRKRSGQTLILVPTLTNVDAASYVPGNDPITGKLEADTVIVEVSEGCFGITKQFKFRTVEAPSVTARVNPADFIVGDPGKVYVGTPVRFQIRNGQGGETYVWDFGDGTPVVNQAYPDSVVSHTFDGITTYDIKLTTTGASGCSTTEVIRITVKTRSQNPTGESPFYVPNAFSPLAQGEQNQYFRISGEIKRGSSFAMKVYDRWGIEVYSTTSADEAINSGWSGKKNNSGDYLDSGNYTYTIACTLQDGKKIEQSGNITLIR